ncbi:arylsulfotransferase family protein [bacterium]|nr:arylsulfotransferase family protein [bacterium]
MSSKNFLYILMFFQIVFFSILATGLSNNTTVLPKILSKPINYLSTDFVNQIRILYYNLKVDNIYLVQNEDLNYEELPKDEIKANYLLDWSYNKEDTFFVERINIKNDSIIKRLFFTADFLHEQLFNYSFLQDNGDIIDKSSVNVRPKHFLFSKLGVIYNIKHGPLICSDKSNSIIWKNNDFTFHHSIEEDFEGNIWTCGLKNVSSKKNNELKYNAIPFYIVLVDHKTGETLFSKSIVDILEDNNLNWMLNWKSLNSGVNDYHHLNDVQPIIHKTLFSETNNLLISLRELNMVFLYNPITNKVEYHTFSSSNAQHDVDVFNDSCISIFSNNSYYTNTSSFLNSIEILNLITGEKRKFRNDIFEKYKINTPHQGLCEILSDDVFMIEETEAGIVYIIEKNNIKTYYSQQGANAASMLGWSRITKQ